MARITGMSSGLTGIASVAAVQAEKRKRATKETHGPKAKVYHDNEYRCVACGADVFEKQSKQDLKAMRQGHCVPCAQFFGTLAFGGCTRERPEDALEKFEHLARDGFLMVLRNLHVGTPDGMQLEVEAGDVFQCRASARTPTEGGPPSKERTWQLFMLDLQVGPYQMRFFPHEWSAISLHTVMDLRKRGELVEGFMCTEDSHGHFAPTPAIREQINAAFGRLIN